jgi:phosphatidylserine/phosphatidylglycerophosphate/cardiolipin synthase-like enzyme
MYELADPTAEADLVADAARGVDVRVVLDQHLERSVNTAAYDYLTAHGVHARWGPAGTTYHQKTLTVDDATSVIMTFNLVTEDYSDTRDFAVIDTRRADVAAIVTTFNADFAGAPELAGWRQERRVRRPVRISLTRISGCSKAAKCPPLSASP